MPNYDRMLLHTYQNNIDLTHVSVVSGNGLSPVRRIIITWTTADLLSVENYQLKTSVKLESIYKTFIHDNAFENVI